MSILSRVFFFLLVFVAAILWAAPSPANEGFFVHWPVSAHDAKVELVKRGFSGVRDVVPIDGHPNCNVARDIDKSLAKYEKVCFTYADGGPFASDESCSIFAFTFNEYRGSDPVSEDARNCVNIRR